MAKAVKKYNKGGKMTPMQKKVVKRVHTSRMSKKNEDYRKALDAGEAMPPFAGGKPKSMTDKQDKRAAKKEMEKKKALKYNKGGKVVAQGADKKDVRREKKQDRVAARAAKKAKRVGDRNFKRDVKSGKLTPIGKHLVRINETKKK
jgi:hypothetical protein